MSMSAYTHYRVSRLDWAESLPCHWQEGRLRWLARRYAGGTPDRSRLDFWEDGNIPWLNSGSVNDSYIVTPSAHITEEALAKSSARWVPKGALVMALAGQGKTKGMVAQLGIRSTCNQSMAAIVPDAEIEPRFLLWWLTANYQNIRNMAGGDLRDGLNLELLGDIGCPLPTATEQAAIAAFLDRETGKIDALVEAQTRLIELLKEKRQAVISHAVTKGLDPAAPMKDSGVEWLGQVPAHWDIKRLSAEAVFFQGKAHEPFIEDDGEHICVTARFVSTSGQSQKTCSMNLSPAKMGDILMVMSDLPNGRALARAFLVGDDRSYAVNQRVCSIRFKHDDSRFFAHQLNRNKQLLQFNDGVEQTHLKNAAFTKLVLAVPPADEQTRIADRLAHQVSAWDQLTSDAETAIALLQERRAALISAAVTGKIDVRGLAPEQAEAA